jgi:hypothetical protein
MSEKDHRHSFLNPNQKDAIPLTTNRFGHTILGGSSSENILAHDEMNVEVGPSGDIIASRKQDIFQHPAVMTWAKGAGIDPEAFRSMECDEPFQTESQTEPEEDQPLEVKSPELELTSLFDRLPTSLQELEEESRNILSESPRQSKFAKASPESSLPQLPEVKKEPSPPLITSLMSCGSCGGKCPDHAKFCPHCGQGLIRFCIHCGFQFKNSEKFCSDCGERR